MNLAHDGFILWFTGLSGAGKSTLARHIAGYCREKGYKVEVLDGDEIRKNLSKGLGFSKEDRDTNIRRIGYVADLLARNGVIAIVAAISPYREIRDEVRANTRSFIEVYVRCPVEDLIRRDVKGFYGKALAGEIQGFTGVSDPYEEPLRPEIVVETKLESANVSASRVLRYLMNREFIPEDTAI